MPATHRSATGPSSATPLARIVLALLVLATLGGLAIAQQLKHEEPLVRAGAIWRPTLSFDPRSRAASLTFETSYQDDVTVSIVSARTGKVVAILEPRDEPVRGWHRTRPFYWYGRTSSGALAPTGSYTAEVHFRRLERTAPIPSLVLHVKDGVK